MGCQDPSPGARICFSLPGPAWGHRGSQNANAHPGEHQDPFWGVRTHSGGEERGGGQGLGEPLSFWEYQDPFWSVIAHPGGAETHFEVSEPILDCQNQLQGSHCPYWCARVPFWGTTVHPGVPEPILGCQCLSGVPGHILAWRCPSWGIRICFGVPGLILGCHWLF